MKEKSIYKFSMREVIVLLLMVAVVSLATGFAVANRVLKDKNEFGNAKSNASLQTFIKNYNYIVENYYGEINEDELLDSALEGVLNALEDPYTVYIDEDAVDNFNIRLDGSYQGLGIEIYSNLNNQIEIVSVFDGSPADKAGLQKGDIIIKLDDVVVDGDDSEFFADKVKSPENKQFSVTIDRLGEVKEIDITKEVVNITSVESRILEKKKQKVGYLGISVFANNTYAQVKEQLDDLEKKNIDSLIIDVRDNTGGHLTSVENILSLFLDKSHIIYQMKDESGIQKVYSEGLKTKAYPIVVLTNGISASASEILTAALKEEYGAQSVGEKTYGKGSAQELRTLPDGTQYKITTKVWLTPEGKSINEVGVDVDLEVKLNIDYYTNPTDENDNQLQSALDLLTRKN